jgi:hypothetical protein
MELNILESTPTWAQHPGRSYETTFIYTGMGRVNTHTQTYQAFQHTSTFLLFERPFKSGVISRAYSTELATVTEYSKNPRRWKEETVNGTFYFEQLTATA